MLGTRTVLPKSSSCSTSLIRPRSVLQEEDDNQTNNSINKTKISSFSPIDGSSPAKKRRLNEDDLIAREELSPDDDWEVNDRFDVIGHLGDGTYGIVYKAIDRNRANEIVAVKKITFHLDDHGRMPNCVVREIANLRYLQRNSYDLPIIRLLDAVPSDGRHTQEMVLHMVFEYMDQDLDSFIRCASLCGGIETELLKDIFHQVVAGVEWMHIHNVIHRDLKPQNILITDRNVKIADFGMSRIIDDNVVLSTQVVTQWYRSPEVLLGCTYSKAVDIWSLGCIFAEMISGRPLFASKRKGDKWQLEEILKVLGTPPKEEWPVDTPIVVEQFNVYPTQSWSHHVPSLTLKAEELLSRMLQFQASRRVSAHDILRDDFFSVDTESCPSVMSSVSPSPSPSPSPSLGSTTILPNCTSQSTGESKDTPSGVL